MGKLIIFGEDILAEMAKFYFENDSNYSVSGFVADGTFIQNERNHFLGLPLIESNELMETFPPGEYDAFVAIGYSDMNRNREKKMSLMQRMGYHLVSYVSSTCICWNKQSIGNNCMIMENVIIQPFATLGDGCMISSGVSINHGCKLDNNIFMGSNAVLGGCVMVGKNAFIGINASVRDHVNVAEFSLVGAGAYISEDTTPYGLYGTNGTVDLLSERIEEEKKNIQALML